MIAIVTACAAFTWTDPHDDQSNSRGELAHAIAKYRCFEFGSNADQ